MKSQKNMGSNAVLEQKMAALNILGDPPPEPDPVKEAAEAAEANLAEEMDGLEGNLSSGMSFDLPEDRTNDAARLHRYLGKITDDGLGRNEKVALARQINALIWRIAHLDQI